MVPWFRYIIVFNTMVEPGSDSRGQHVYTIIYMYASALCTNVYILFGTSIKDIIVY